MRKLVYSLIFFLFTISLIFAGIIFHFRNQELRIIFFNVGQGDAILIEKGSTQILIDGGLSGKLILGKLGRAMPFWDRKIELIIATHPDKDHISGLVEVMNNYQIGAVIDNGVSSDSSVYQKYLAIIQNNKIERLLGGEGMEVELGEVDLKILYPDFDPGNNLKDTNAKSIVAKLIYGENSFLFTGDFPNNRDSVLLSREVDLSARVLKVAHHGSKNATSFEFLERVNPREAIISVAKKNSYGHPASEILERLKEKNVRIFRTDEQGDIEYVCANVENFCEAVKLLDF